MTTRELRVEYLVVGAGAAGCTLGYLLRRAGADVLALEICDLTKKDKLCGGALGTEAIEYTKDIFGEQAIEELNPGKPACLVCRTLNRVHTTSCGFETIPRKRFDDWLLAQYVAAGGKTLDRIRLDSIDPTAHLAICTDLRTRETLRITYGTIVGADGASSAVRRLLTGRKQRIVVSVQGTVAKTRDDTVFAYHPARPGYCWYIPTDDVANVGCGIYGKTARDCRSWLASFCEEEGIELPALRGAPIPTGDDIMLAPAQDAWLVGDAAGLISPSVSGGIHHALESAYLLADCLTKGYSYTDAMEPIVKRITVDVSIIGRTYLATSLFIAERGEPWQTPLNQRRPDTER